MKWSERGGRTHGDCEGGGRTHGDCEGDGRTHGDCGGGSKTHGDCGGGGRTHGDCEGGSSVSNNTPVSVRQPALQWSNNPKKVQPFPFKNTPGITKRMSSDAIELDYFTLFMTTELIEMIVVETNRYAAEIRAKVPDDKPHAQIRSWKEVNSDSIWRMIALTTAMGITKKPTTDSYWSTKAVWQTKCYASVVSRNRYKVILQSLHFQNNQLNKPEGDRIWKLRPLYEMLTAKFTSVYVPEQDISIDESLLLYKGRLFFKQYIPNKRSRFGIKSYELCESRSGYTWKYSLYTGQDGTLLDGVHGSSYCIVMKLLDGYRLAVDNYYNSPQLCSDLFDAQTNCIGTVR